MKSNPVIYYNLIIRSQIEYSASNQAVIVRCILETPANGHRRGFTNIDAMLAVLRAELMGVQNGIMPQGQETE